MPRDDDLLLQELTRREPGLCVMPRAYPCGRIVEVRFAYDGRVIFDGVTAEKARMLAAFHRCIAAELDRAAAHVEKVVANGCEGTA